MVHTLASQSVVKTVYIPRPPACLLYVNVADLNTLCAHTAPKW